MATEKTELRRHVLLSFQVALLGMVTQHLRGVTVDWTEKSILARCIFDGPVETEERDLCSEIETEIIASFPHHEVSVTASSLERSKSLRSQLLKAWVYRRRE